MALPAKGNFICVGIIVSTVIIFAIILCFSGNNSTEQNSDATAPGPVSNPVIQPSSKENELLQNEIIQLRKDISLKDTELAEYKTKCPAPMSNETVKYPRHCEDIQMAGEKRSGIYTIYPFESQANVPVEVYCDLLTEGGGWTVFQRRRPRILVPVHFERTWKEYVEGFSGCSKADSHWLGLNIISELTKVGDVHLRIDMTDWDNTARFAEYTSFKVADETKKFNLSISGYYGDAGRLYPYLKRDSLAFHNGMYFSTKDVDNDNYLEGSCADSYRGGWWYEYCHQANLNGPYVEHGRNVTEGQHVTWEAWHGHFYSLKTTEMKLRSKSFKPLGRCIEG